METDLKPKPGDFVAGCLHLEGADGARIYVPFEGKVAKKGESLIVEFDKDYVKKNLQAIAQEHGGIILKHR